MPARSTTAYKSTEPRPLSPPRPLSSPPPDRSPHPEHRKTPSTPAFPRLEIRPELHRPDPTICPSSSPSPTPEQAITYSLATKSSPLPSLSIPITIADLPRPSIRSMTIHFHPPFSMLADNSPIALLPHASNNNPGKSSWLSRSLHRSSHCLTAVPSFPSAKHEGNDHLGTSLRATAVRLLFPSRYCLRQSRRAIAAATVECRNQSSICRVRSHPSEQSSEVLHTHQRWWSRPVGEL